MTCLIYAQEMETWNYHIESSFRQVPQIWKDEFQRNSIELEEIIEFQEYKHSLVTFYNEKAEDGFYAFFVHENPKLIQIYYFQVQDNNKYLLSYIEEKMNAKNIGLFLFQTFHKTYPTPLEVVDGMSQASTLQGFVEGEIFYDQESLRGEKTPLNKITVDYMDEEDVYFQASEIVDGTYRRATIDNKGRINFAESIPSIKDELPNFTIYYTYGWGTRFQNNNWPAFSYLEFNKYPLRRTMPITLFLVHKQKYYRPLMIQTTVPLLSNKITTFHKILHIDDSKDDQEFRQPVYNYEPIGEEDTKLQLQRRTAKIELQLIDINDNPISYGRANDGFGKIEIYTKSGIKVMHKGKNSFRPPRTSELELDYAEYTFTYTPFNLKKYIVQQKKVVIHKNHTAENAITFKAFQRIPNYFYEIDNNIYKNTLVPLFKEEEIEIYLKSIEHLSDLFDLLQERKASPETWENFIHTLLDTYEANKDKIEKAIPANHPHKLTFYFNLVEAYWARSKYSNPIPNLEKALQILMQENITFKEFYQKWYFTDNKIQDIRTFSRNLFRQRPGLFKEVRNKWDRYRLLYCLSAIQTYYYNQIYQDISDDACNAFGATILTLSQCYKMKQERNIALGEERPGLDYNIATYLAEILEKTQTRAQSTASWTSHQKEKIGYHFYESETKHIVYASLAYLEALSDEMERPERWDLHIIPKHHKEIIQTKCTPIRRQTLENFVNEILRKWHKK